jgi:hypothetical protein
MKSQIPEKAAKAIRAWCNSYSAKLDRINNGSNEDYTGYEQDLFEAFGCQTFDPTDPVTVEVDTTKEFVEIRQVYETLGYTNAILRYREIFHSDLVVAKEEVEALARKEGWTFPRGGR